MQNVAVFAYSLFTRLNHWLVVKQGSRYVLAGTLALAGIGALLANQPAAVAKPTPFISTPIGTSSNQYTFQYYDNDSDRDAGGHGWFHHHHLDGDGVETLSLVNGNGD
jgi:hypothetical protein